MANDLEAAWASFEAECVPPETGAVQRMNVKRCFYCGAAAVFSLVVSSICNDEDAPDGPSLMSRLNDELEAFHAQGWVQ